jgi:hypothetical protein
MRFESFSCNGISDVSPRQVEEIRPFLTDRDDYPEWYVSSRIRRAICVARAARKTGRVASAKEVGESVRKTLNALRVLENAKSDLLALPVSPLAQVSIEDLRRERMKFEKLERLAHDMAAASRRRSGGKRNVGRKVAVREAHDLLRDFGNTPTRTRDGPWHSVANILYDDRGADLFQALLDHRCGPEIALGDEPKLHEIVRSQTGKK